jgi:hypothetical protein
MRGRHGVRATIPTSSQKKQNREPISQPAERWVVVCVDEMGPLACIPRGGRAWGKGPARRPDRYHPSSTIQLLAAFAPHTGHAVGVPSPNKTGEVVLTFLQETVWPHFGAASKIYVVWDNFSAHKRALICGARGHPTLRSSGLRPMPRGSTSSSLGFSCWRKPRCTTPTSRRPTRSLRI